MSLVKNHLNFLKATGDFIRLDLVNLNKNSAFLNALDFVLLHNHCFIHTQMYSETSNQHQFVFKQNHEK